MTDNHTKRNRMTNQLLMRGHGTMDEILTASFGEWPPKGLDIVGHNNQRVNLVSILDRSMNDTKRTLLGRIWNSFMELTGTCGRGTLSGERTISINRLLCGFLPPILGGEHAHITLGHEAAHILQGDHYWRAATLFRRKDVQTIWGYQNDALSNIIADRVFDKHLNRSPLRTLFNKVSKYIYHDLDYLKEGMEIQARLHEVMATGYPAWGRLPGNDVELFAALEDAGLPMPKELKDQLDGLPRMEEARAIFTGARQEGPLPDGLRFACNALTEEGRVQFWRQTMTALYVDLIEMYGDREGRARFGFGINPRAAYRSDNIHFEAPAAAAHQSGLSA